MVFGGGDVVNKVVEQSPQTVENWSEVCDWLFAYGILCAYTHIIVLRIP